MRKTTKLCPVCFIICCFVTGLISIAVRADEPRTSDAELATKAQRLEALVEEKMLQQHGMIPMFVRASDFQLPTAEDYQGAYRHRHLHGKTEEELGLPPMHVWRAWENTASDTAYYLAAMSFKYRVTHDPDTLAVCRRTLAALKYIYMLPIENGGEAGFLCKPYGGKYSNQSSLDQVQCVTWGLAAYRPIAPPEDVATIDQMTEDFSRFLMRYQYTMPNGYFGISAAELRHRQGVDYASRGWKRAVIVLPVLNLAWRGTGDDDFANEIDHWYTECDKLPRSILSAKKFSAAGFGDRPRNLYLCSLLMDMDPSRYTRWRDIMKSYYLQGRTGLLEDGTYVTSWTYDSTQGGMKPKEMPSVGGGYGRTGRSAIFAMGCVAAQRWLRDVPMQDDARKILLNLDEDTFRFIMPLDEKHPLPSEWQVESKMLDGDCLTAWLCAYWEGRYRGYW